MVARGDGWGTHPGEYQTERPPTMTNNNPRHTALQKLIDDDAIGQLRRRDGLMATLGSEDGSAQTRLG